MNDLDRSLLALADRDARAAAPPAVRTAVMQAWDAMHLHSHRSKRGTGAVLVAIGSMAAAIVAMVISRAPSEPVHRQMPTVAPALEQPRVIANSAVPTVEVGLKTAPLRARPRPSPARSETRAARYQAGVVLVADPIVDASAMSIVRVRVPRAALVTLGIPLVEPNEGGSVDLEMIVGEDGVARAIRRAVPVASPQE